MSIFAACRMAMAAGNAGGCAAVGTTLTTSNQTTAFSEDASHVNIQFDPHNENRFLLSYTASSSNPIVVTCAVGTVSSSGFTFGSSYTLQSARCEKPSIAWNPSVEDEFVVAYVTREGSVWDYGDARVGTITSNTVISYSSSVHFNAGYTGQPKVAFDPNSSGDLLIAYADIDNSSRTTVVCGTLSSGTLAFASTSYTLASGYGLSSDSPHSLAYDSQTAGKFAVIQYADSTYYGSITVGTISSQVITLGSPYTYRSEAAYYAGISADPFNADKFVIASGHWTSSSRGKALIVTVSGTTPTSGSLVTFGSTTVKATYSTVQYSHTNEDKVLISWKDGSTNYLKTVAGTISGSTITLGTTTTPYSAAIAFPTVGWDYVECGQYVVAHRAQDSAGYYPIVHKGVIS